VKLVMITTGSINTTLCHSSTRLLTCGYADGFDMACYPEQKAFDLKSKSWAAKG